MRLYSNNNIHPALQPNHTGLAGIAIFINSLPAYEKIKLQ